MSRNVAILYWGTRGGGPRLLMNLVNSGGTDNERLFFYISTNNELLQDFRIAVPTQLVVTKLPKNRIRLLVDIPLKIRSVRHALTDLKSKKITRVYFLLPHPWDLYLAKKIIRTGKIEVWRGIHDLRRHPGDLWPNLFTTRRLIQYSTTLICFISHIEKELLKYGKPVIRSHLFEVNRGPKIHAAGSSVLFVGRFRKYKGLNLLAKAWPLVINSNKTLTVAGKGRFPNELQKNGARIIKKWLSNSEIEELISKSKLVVLPYVEASQSGVIAIAHSLSTPVVVTPVGGLVDQVIEGKNGLIAAEVTPKALAMAIDAALTRNWALEIEENPLPNFLSKLQMD